MTIIIFSAPKSTQTNKVVPKDRVLQGAVEQLFIPDGNSLFEIDIVQGYNPEVIQHVRRKRQAEEKSLERKSSSKKRRRKKKKRRRSEKKPGAVTTLREITPTEKIMLPPVEREPENPPMENALEPARKSRRTFRPPPPTDPAPTLPALVLSEMENNNDDNSGLLKVKSLKSVFINTDNMRTNKLMADRIKADAIHAKDVVVTSKKKKSGSRSGGRKRRRRVRPSTAEFIEQGPLFEHDGTQRVNSILEQPQYIPETILTKNPYGLGDTIYQPEKPRRRFRVNERHLYREPLTVDPYGDALTSGRPEVAHPEFISSRVRSKVPLLSEFIEGTSGNSKPSTTFVNRRRPFAKQRPIEEFHIFDNPINTERQNPVAKRVDKTSKRFTKNVDPWFL